MLKIAVPNKGSLADAAVEILKEAGYRQRVDSRDLVLSDPENGVEFYYLRPRDIALYVGTGELEAGIILEAQHFVSQDLPLKVGKWKIFQVRELPPHIQAWWRNTYLSWELKRSSSDWTERWKVVCVSESQM